MPPGAQNNGADVVFWPGRQLSRCAWLAALGPSYTGLKMRTAQNFDQEPVYLGLASCLATTAIAHAQSWPKPNCSTTKIAKKKAKKPQPNDKKLQKCLLLILPTYFDLPPLAALMMANLH